MLCHPSLGLISKFSNGDRVYCQTSCNYIILYTCCVHDSVLFITSMRKILSCKRVAFLHHYPWKEIWGGFWASIFTPPPILANCFQPLFDTFGSSSQHFWLYTTSLCYCTSINALCTRNLKNNETKLQPFQPLQLSFMNVHSWSTNWPSVTPIRQ